MNKTQASISLCLSLGTTSLVGEGGGGGMEDSKALPLKRHYQNLGCLFG